MARIGCILSAVIACCMSVLGDSLTYEGETPATGTNWGELHWHYTQHADHFDYCYAIFVSPPTPSDGTYAWGVETPVEPVGERVFNNVEPWTGEWHASLPGDQWWSDYMPELIGRSAMIWHTTGLTAAGSGYFQYWSPCTPTQGHPYDGDSGLDGDQLQAGETWSSPEPSSLCLAIAGLAAVAAVRAKRRALVRGFRGHRADP